MLSCDEYIVEIDKNGKINKIPYSPLLDVMGEENYKKYIKKLEENKLNKEIENNKNKFINLDHHWVEVEKEEEDYEKLIEKEEEDYEKLIEDFKEEFIESMPGLIEVEEIKNAELILTIRKTEDYFDWDVERNENPDIEMMEIENKLYGMLFYGFRRKDQQNSIDSILDYIYNTLKKELY